MMILAGLLLLVAAPVHTPAPAPKAAQPAPKVERKADDDFSDVKPRPGFYLSKHGISGEAVYVNSFGQIENIA